MFNVQLLQSFSDSRAFFYVPRRVYYKLTTSAYTRNECAKTGNWIDANIHILRLTALMKKRAGFLRLIAYSCSR